MQPIKSLGYLTESPEEDCKSLAQEPTNFFLRGQTVNILGSAGQPASVTTTRLQWCTAESATVCQQMGVATFQ